MARGIISPPRGRHSYKPSGSRIRPQCPRTTTAVNPNEHRSDRKETQSTAVKPNATRATKNNDDRSSNTSRIDPPKSTSKAVSSRRPIATPNPNEKKLDNNNSTPKTATVILLVTILMVVISYSGGLYGTPSDDPDGRNQLQQLSIDGKDLANIALHANSIYESVGSDTKKEGSSQSNNAPRIFQIYKEIASHRQGNSSITSYFTKLKALWDELATYIDVTHCSCGSIEKLSEHMEREKVLQFLVGLNQWRIQNFC